VIGCSKLLPVLIFGIVLSAVCTADDKPISFSADRMSGAAGKKDEKTVLSGHASVSVGSLWITGDEIELSGTDFRYVKAFGNVTGVDSEQGFSFTADILSYDRETETASFQGSAKLVDTKHDVETSAGLIVYNKQTEIAQLQTGVKLKRKNIDCVSEFALYRRSVSMLDLTGKPVVTRDGDEFKANRITVNLETEFITLDGSVSGKLKETKKKEEAGSKAASPASGDAGAGSSASASGDVD